MVQLPYVNMTLISQRFLLKYDAPDKVKVFAHALINSDKPLSSELNKVILEKGETARNFWKV